MTETQRPSVEDKRVYLWAITTGVSLLLCCWLLASYYLIAKDYKEIALVCVAVSIPCGSVLILYGVRTFYRHKQAQALLVAQSPGRSAVDDLVLLRMRSLRLESMVNRYNNPENPPSKTHPQDLQRLRLMHGRLQRLYGMPAHLGPWFVTHQLQETLDRIEHASEALKSSQYEDLKDNLKLCAKISQEIRVQWGWRAFEKTSVNAQQKEVNPPSTTEDKTKNEGNTSAEIQ